MCGLAGFITATDCLESTLAETATRMAAVLAHRGPDDAGVWTDAPAGIAFAHRRLAVVDLSAEGHQPMVSSDGRYVLAFNGEIYNHPELRRRLGQGRQLRGHSDTEVLLETVAHTSVDHALDVANGMFALALWDRHERVLTLARDRLGEKPLYYCWTGREFVFGSELLALQQHPSVGRTLAMPAVAQVVRQGFVSGAHSILDGVLRLPAGHLLRVGPGIGYEADSRPYWSLWEVASSRHLQAVVSDAEILDYAEELLTEAVAMRMVADVPLGAFLSGGVDSSLVVALMQRAGGTTRTFTVGVGGHYDEAAQARRVAEILGTQHTEIVLDEVEALAVVADVPGMYDEPFADPSAIPTALISAAARRHVTVCLTGDGADELFAGYNRYLTASPALSWTTRLPARARTWAADAMRAVSPSRWDALSRPLAPLHDVPDLGSKMHKLAKILRADDAYGAYLAVASHADPSDLLLDHAFTAEPEVDASVLPSGLDPLHVMLYLDGMVTLPDNMLTKVDRASMAASLECRVPFLDHRFVELAWTLPSGVKLRGHSGKWLLRAMLGRHLPQELIDRPKRGFDPPLAQWLRGPLHDWTRDLLAPAGLRRQGIFDPDAVQRLCGEHMSGARNHDYALWALVVFQAWLLANDQATPPSTVAMATTTHTESST